MAQANIIYLSKNMNTYRGAMYQQNIMEELARQANVCLSEQCAGFKEMGIMGR